jgi:hypothetical protein
VENHAPDGITRSTLVSVSVCASAKDATAITIPHAPIGKGEDDDEEQMIEAVQNPKNPVDETPRRLAPARSAAHAGLVQ